MEKLFDEAGQHMLDPLLEILMCSEEFRLSNLVTNIEGFKKVFSTQSGQVTNFLNDAVFYNEQTVEISALRWNKKHKIITFGACTC